MAFSSGNIEFSGARYGLNTNDPAFLLLPGEAAELLNWKVLKGGAIQTRPPVTKITNTAATKGVNTFSQVTIGSTAYDLLVDSDYELYYLDASDDPTSIGTLEGDAEILPFNAQAVLMDGSYLKYLDAVSSIKLAYDDGTGTSGYQVNHLTDTSDTFLALGNGTNTRLAQKFTSQAWDSGYTIPPTRLSVNLSSVGNPTGAITMKVRKVSGDSVLATKTFLADVTDLTPTEDVYFATFAASDITTEMSSATAYYVTLEHTGGDSSNYVKVHCNNIGSGGLAYTYAGSYSADATKNIIAGLRPGRPPKASFGIIHNNRLFIKDPDNPGRMKFCTANSIFDWSTADYAGYIGTIDSNANSFPIGAFALLYSELYVFGMEGAPYICKLTGSIAAEYELVKTGQIAWSNSRSVITTGNDVWFASSDGVNSYSGVQEYGDLRVRPYSSPVQDKFTNWSTSTSKAGYYPDDGQYWLFMPSYHRILVCNIKSPTRDPSGIGARYPWCEYELVRDIFTSDDYKWVANGSEYYLQAAAGGDPGIDEPDFVTLDGSKITEGTAGSLGNHQWDYGQDPTKDYYTIYFKDSDGDPDTSNVVIKSIIAPQCFYTGSGTMYIGGSDGHVYKVDTGEYKDLTSYHPTYDWRGRYAPSSDYITLIRQQLIIAGTEGAQLNFSVYKNDKQSTAALTTTFYLTVDDRLTAEDLVGDVGDAYYLVDPDGVKTWNDIRVTGYSFQPRIHSVYPSGQPVLFRGCFFQTVQAE